MIEDWIDTLVDVWKFATPEGGTMKSPYIVKDKKFPASISPANDFPIALTIPAMVQPKYSKGSKHITWYGTTEFHIAPDLSRAHLPRLILYPSLILRAAAARVQLSGVPDGIDIGSFYITDDRDGIAGPVALQWGDESPHWCFVVKWIVEESLNGTQLPVSA